MSEEKEIKKEDFVSKEDIELVEKFIAMDQGSTVDEIAKSMKKGGRIDKFDTTNKVIIVHKISINQSNFEKLGILKIEAIKLKADLAKGKRNARARVVADLLVRDYAKTSVREIAEDIIVDLVNAECQMEPVIERYKTLRDEAKSRLQILKLYDQQAHELAMHRAYRKGGP